MGERLRIHGSKSRSISTLIQPAIFQRKVHLQHLFETQFWSFGMRPLCSIDMYLKRLIAPFEMFVMTIAYLEESSCVSAPVRHQNSVCRICENSKKRITEFVF